MYGCGLFVTPQNKPIAIQKGEKKKKENDKIKLNMKLKPQIQIYSMENLLCGVWCVVCENELFFLLSFH